MFWRCILNSCTAPTVLHKNCSLQKLNWTPQDSRYNLQGDSPPLLTHTSTHMMPTVVCKTSCLHELMTFVLINIPDWMLMMPSSSPNPYAQAIMGVLEREGGLSRGYGGVSVTAFYCYRVLFLGFLEKELQMWKRRGWMMCWGFHFTQRGRCLFTTATDTSSVPQLVLSGGLESTSRPAGPPASRWQPGTSSKSGLIRLPCLDRWVFDAARLFMLWLVPSDCVLVISLCGLLSHQANTFICAQNAITKKPQLRYVRRFGVLSFACLVLWHLLYSLHLCFCCCVHIRPSPCSI